MDPIKEIEALKKDLKETTKHYFLERFLHTIRNIESLRNTQLFSNMYDFKPEKSTMSKFMYIKFNNNEKLVKGLKETELSGYAYHFENVSNFYKEQVDIFQDWLVYMNLLEKVLLQLECFINPKIAYGIQPQKSGDNSFNYIVLRTPFYEIKEGKIELRTYYNKLEDYKDYSDLEELKNNDEFRKNTTDFIRGQMISSIKKSFEMFDTLKSVLNKEADCYTKEKAILVKNINKT
jgi:hypothetical protein